jgi:hypothetical protein
MQYHFRIRQRRQTELLADLYRSRRRHALRQRGHGEPCADSHHASANEHLGPRNPGRIERVRGNCPNPAWSGERRQLQRLSLAMLPARRREPAEPLLAQLVGFTVLMGQSLHWLTGWPVTRFARHASRLKCAGLA